MNMPSASRELLIVGAGPAGMAAALAAAPSGARITLLDDNPAPGGQIWRDGPGAHLPPQALRMREALARCANVRVLCGTRVVSLAGAGALLLEDATHGWVQRYDKLILCTGARELLLPFPGWTLPGVTGAGGLQALIKAGMPVAGERIVIAGSGPLLLVAAATARQAGAKVLRIAEQAGFTAVAGFAAQLPRWPGKATQALGLASTRYRTGTHIVCVQGAGRVESVRLQHAGRETDIACDRVACGFGLVPNTELGRLLGCALTAADGNPQALAVNALQETSMAGVYAAGECTGIGGSERALAQGRIAGFAAVNDKAAAQRHNADRAHWHAFAAELQKRFTLAPSLKTLARADTLVCRCEDVPRAALSGCSGWTEAKLHTRCGMGACQGRVCGAAAQFLFGWTPPAPRPPLSPARIATLACAGDAAATPEPGA
ncbi:FAD-dependent oxidoreductase [Polaromonas sp. YR568]|uniref:FAD-dependent oxidoreductase n=1 Tax=Polaromonas sp. YR568 TaxID=1855301 RepID=UPI00398BFBC9